MRHYLASSSIKVYVLSELKCGEQRDQGRQLEGIDGCPTGMSVVLGSEFGFSPQQ